MGRNFAQSNGFTRWKRKEKTIKSVRSREEDGERDMGNRINMICGYEAEHFSCSKGESKVNVHGSLF
jgi:hypothetical protein